jgi:hypothetical protein
MGTGSAYDEAIIQQRYAAAAQYDRQIALWFWEELEQSLHVTGFRNGLMIAALYGKLQ